MWINCILAKIRLSLLKLLMDFINNKENWLLLLDSVFSVQLDQTLKAFHFHYFWQTFTFYITRCENECLKTGTGVQHTAGLITHLKLNVKPKKMKKERKKWWKIALNSLKTSCLLNEQLRTTVYWLPDYWLWLCVCVPEINGLLLNDKRGNFLISSRRIR